MKIKLIGKPETIMKNEGSIHNYFGWPTVTKLKNGDITVGASGFRASHECPFGKAVIAYSSDEGKTYTRPSVIIDTMLDDRDVGLVPFGESGLILTSFNVPLEHTIEMYEDAEKYKDLRFLLTEHKDYVNAYLKTASEVSTQKASQNICFSYDNGKTFGEVYKAPVSSPHGPIVKKDGSIFWIGHTHGDEYDTDSNGRCLQAYKIGFDGKAEYISSIPNVIEDEMKMHSCEPHAIELDDGKILCHFRVDGIDGGIPDESGKRTVFSVYQTVSEDGGKTWSTPERLLGREGGSPAFLFRHSSGVLISLYGYRVEPYKIRAMFSKDGGKTWDTDNDIYINGVDRDMGYPSTVELNDGSLLTVFYAHETEDKPATIIQQKWDFEREI